MNSTKSLIGHVLGGASGVEAVATIKALQTGAWQRDAEHGSVEVVMAMNAWNGWGVNRGQDMSGAGGFRLSL